MSVQLDVEDVVLFERPLARRFVSKNVQITNPHSKPVAFKVKTTAPKLYCVRPNSDIIPAKGTTTVQVIHQGFPAEPPADFKCKDKFLFVSVLADGELESKDVKEIWNQVEVRNKGLIHQQKLRVEYVYALPERQQQPVPIEVPDSPEEVEAVLSQEADTVLSGETESEMCEITEINEESTEGLQAQVKRLENELKRCREKIENMPTVQKTTESPVGMFVLFAMLALAIAYFVQKQQV
ncbi:hypothetical protein G6F56_003564 [Rhizopus delemar]|nr:hypothetical protein G6F56_003564 [Rhizopus delemar]